MNDWLAVAILMGFAVLLPPGLYLMIRWGLYELRGMKLRVMNGLLFVAFAAIAIGQLLAPDGSMFSAGIGFLGAFNCAGGYFLVTRLQQHEREGRL